MQCKHELRIDVLLSHVTRRLLTHVILVTARVTQVFVKMRENSYFLFSYPSYLS